LSQVFGPEVCNGSVAVEAALTPVEAKTVSELRTKIAMMHRTAGFASLLKLRESNMLPKCFVFISLPS
jgi:hypothetical protein